MNYKILGRYCFIYLMAFLPFVTFSQIPELLPSITSSTIPGDQEEIGTASDVGWDFYYNGIAEGELIPDFTLFDVNGNRLNMAEKLAEGKPVVLIAGSYTCWVFRGKVNMIRQIAQGFAGQIKIIVVYTIEAHPVNEYNVYSGVYEGLNLNAQQGIMVGQPRTYGERREAATAMINDLDLDFPVYLDDPDNNWWWNFGPAPNNAYLIDTTGTVFRSHGWFDRYPDNILCDLSSYFEIDICSTQLTGEFETTDMDLLLFVCLEFRLSFLGLSQLYSFCL